MRYTAIAEIGNTLAERLRIYMVPEVVMNPEHIGLCSPADKGDFMVGIYLYDIKECEEIRSHSMIMVDSKQQKYPSCFLNLYYMITAYSNGDIKYRSEEEQKILGKIVQVLQDYGVFEHMAQGKGLPDGETIPAAEMLNLPLEEKLRIWNIPNVAYKTSLFYKVGPIEIQSEKTRDTQRVVDAVFRIDHQSRES